MLVPLYSSQARDHLDEIGQVVTETISIIPGADQGTRDVLLGESKTLKWAW